MLPLFQLLYATLPLFLVGAHSVTEQSLFPALIALFFSLVFYGAPLVLVKNTRQLAWAYLFLGTGAWVFLYILYRHNGVPISLLPDIFATSSPREAFEYVSANHLWPWLFLLGAAFLGGIYAAIRTEPGELPPVLRKKVLALVLATTALSLHWDYLPSGVQVFPSPVSDTAAAEIYPVGLVKFAGAGVSRWLRKENTWQPFNAVRELPPAEPELHILVIGESARFDRWHLNGYSRATSPRLDRLGKHELISFTKAHAGGNVTMLGVPIMLSGIPAEQYTPGLAVRNLLGLMKEAGFMTAWMSSQDTQIARHARSPADFEVERHNTMGKSEYRLFDRFPFDEELLPSLERFANYGHQKKFVILHTTGSHQDYALRYPPAFDKFSAHQDGLYLGSGHEATQDAYDNSILYTDWFLGQVVEIARRQPGIATVTYISDHGEALYDGGENRFGHGSGDAPAEEQHIPMFIWGNETFRTRYSSKWQIMLNNRQRALGQENYLHTVADLLDIRYPGQNLAMSFAQRAYRIRPGAQVLANSGRLVPVRVQE